MRTRYAKNRRRGMTLVEVIIAAQIIGISVVALAQFWNFSFSMTTQATNQGLAYSIARSAMEQVRQTGFANTAEGSTTVYYDANGTFPPSASQVSATAYSVTTSVISDKFTGALPANDALRTVTVTVKLSASGKTVYQTNTALARSGV